VTPPAAKPSAATPPAATPAVVPPPGSAACFADVSSQPAGAEIVVEQNVVGTTPMKVELPCGLPVDVVIRKARLVSATRTITPTPDGVPVKITLAKPTFQVKVSSIPAGATITMNGKSIGVTPTLVRVPAFEPSSLTLTKDGYSTETEKVAPKANGVAVHTVLKKLDRKKPR
jgi:hypothetical protein